MTNTIKKLLLLSLLALLVSCASPRTSYEPPTIGISSFNLLPSESIVPKFEIGLHIVNPNRESLELEGIFYTLNIEDHRVLAGVANDLQEIEGYGEGDITLEASVDVISGVKLLRSLLTRPQSSYDYAFNAKLDVGGFLPPINITETGQFTTGFSQ